MKKVTTPLKHVLYTNYLGQKINVDHQTQAHKIIKRYNDQKHFLSQFEPNKRAKK